MAIHNSDFRTPIDAGRTGEVPAGRNYVSVVADYSPDGTVSPVSVRFEDGPAFAVTKIISAIRMSMTKHNGTETRYYVRIGEREHYLYFEDARLSVAPRWFVEDQGLMNI